MERRDDRTGHERGLELHCIGKEGRGPPTRHPGASSPAAAPSENQPGAEGTGLGGRFWIPGGKKRTNLLGNNKAHFKTATGLFLRPSP